jgi:hypothetical protein
MPLTNFEADDPDEVVRDPDQGSDFGPPFFLKIYPFPLVLLWAFLHLLKTFNIIVERLCGG